jgi:hypothetical protein
MVISTVLQRLSCSDRENVRGEIGFEIVGTAATRWLVFSVSDHTNLESIVDNYTNTVLYPTTADIEAKLGLNLTRPSGVNGWNFVTGLSVHETFEGGGPVKLSSELFNHLFQSALAYVTGRYC